VDETLCLPGRAVYSLDRLQQILRRAARVVGIICRLSIAVNPLLELAMQALIGINHGRGRD